MSLPIIPPLWGQLCHFLIFLVAYVERASLTKGNRKRRKARKIPPKVRDSRPLTVTFARLSCFFFEACVFLEPPKSRIKRKPIPAAPPNQKEGRLWKEARI